MISDEIRHLLETGSAIRKMWSDGNRLKAEHGAENVADMTLGNPVLPPPPAVLEALEDMVRNPPAGSHRYTPHAGIPEVREAIAAHLTGRDLMPGIGAEEVVVTSGASAAINVALRTILNPGDEVILVAPYFPDYPAHVMNHSGVPIVVPCAEGFLPNPDRIDRAINRRTRALILNHPNNPSGRHYRQELVGWLGGVVDKASKRLGRSIYLISDEPYRELRFTEDPFHSPARYCERGLMAYSFSKSHSIPGERIGYLAVNPACPGREELLAGLSISNRILGFTNAPAIWQRVVARCLDSAVDANGYRDYRDRLFTALTDKGYEVVPSDGTFYLFPRTPGGDDEAFIRRAMQDLVLVVPGGTFGWPGHFRIAFCVDDRSVDLAIERLPDAAALEEEQEV